MEFLFLKSLHILSVASWISMVLTLPIVKRITVLGEGKEVGFRIRSVLIRHGEYSLWAVAATGAGLIYLAPELIIQGWSHLKGTLFVGAVLLFALEKRQMHRGENRGSYGDALQIAIVLSAVFTVVFKPF